MAPLTPLLDPRGFVASRSRLLLAGTTVFAGLVFSRLAWLVISPYLITSKESILTRHHIVLELLGMLLFVILNLIVWVGIAIVLYFSVVILQSLSDGSSTDGTFATALGVAGLSYASDFITRPIAWGITHFQSSTSLSVIEVLTTTAGPLATDPISLLLWGEVTIWTLYILTLGTAEAYDVSIKTAAVPAGIVGAWAIGYALI